MDRDQRRLAQRLDVVHHCRLPSITDADRKRRANPRHAALAFERFEQRRFLAADIGASAEVNVDLEVTTRLATQRLSQEAALSAPREICTQRRQQVRIFAAQVEQALAGTDRQTRDTHAVENQVGIAGEQHAILEGAGFAFVGIADHVATGVLALAFRPACRLPLDLGGETGSPASAQIGSLHFRKHRLGAARNRRPNRFSGWPADVQQGIAATQIVVDPEVFPWPVGQWHLGPDQFADTVDALG